MRRFVIVLSACLAVVGTAVAGFSFAGVTTPQTARATAVTDVNVTATEFRFDMSTMTAPAGVVNFHVMNAGTIEHDFAIAGKDTPTLEPGQSFVLSVTLNPGSYPFACTIGEHASFGMQGFFNVTGQAQTTTNVITTGGTTITTVVTTTQPTTAPPPPSTSVAVGAKEFKFTLPTTSKRVSYYVKVKGKRVKRIKTVKVQKRIKAGTIRFVVKNTGKLGHNFVIAGRQTPILKTGQTYRLDVPLKKGKYKYECSVTGHAALGMRGTLVIS